MKSPYEKYLEIIGFYIDKYFREQAPYIKCKVGCSECCEEGKYPFTHTEFEYLMSGYRTLDDSTKNKIKENIKNIKEEEKSNTDEIFLYRCPFLIDKRCACYEYRGLVCRSHGLITDFVNLKGEHMYSIPYCAHNGLNYSDVYDEKTDMISKEKWTNLGSETGIETEPISYNVGLNQLIDNQISVGLNITFGIQKPLIDWFVEQKE